MTVNAALRDYLLTRRSVGIAFLREPGPSEAELNEIMTIGTRVPDHGKLAPWRLVIIAGDDRIKLGERMAEIAKRQNPGLDEAGMDIERRQFLPAPVTIAVISSPKRSAKAPEWEQFQSAGNVCFNLINGAFALGYAASWVSRWFSLDTEGQQAIGVRGGERLVGVVHIGSTELKPDDRERPALADVVSRWQG
jgi:nitroreductase